MPGISQAAILSAPSNRPRWLSALFPKKYTLYYMRKIARNTAQPVHVNPNYGQIDLNLEVCISNIMCTGQ
jgi:hypothetical protein